MLSTHVQSASSAYFGAKDESVSLAIQSVCVASTSTLRPAEWKLDTQKH